MAKQSRLSFDAGAELSKMIEQRAKQEGITVSEYIREAIYLELFFSGDLVATKFVFTKVAKRAKEALVDRLRRIDVEKQVGELLD